MQEAERTTCPGEPPLSEHDDEGRMGPGNDMEKRVRDREMTGNDDLYYACGAELKCVKIRTLLERC